MVLVVRDEQQSEIEAPGDERGRKPAPSRRFVWAAGAAVLALAAAAIAAAGPAHGKRSVYSWPPSTVPTKAPRDGWYAPLALLNRVPAEMEVRLPCALSPPLRTGDSTTVVSTSRRSQVTGAFEIVLARRSLRFLAGNSPVASIPWPQACPLRVVVRQGQLRLPGRAIPLRLDTPGGMPIVTSLFTRLDIGHGVPPRVVVRTRDYATTQSTRQIAAAMLAVSFACLALLLVAGIRRRPNPVVPLWRALRGAWRARHATDAVVVCVLLLWWVISPTFSDDGWIVTRLLNYSSAGGFSLYYDEFGANQPLGFWIEWSEHFLAPQGLLVLRLPALACLTASWLLCRWVLGRSLPASVRENAVVLWTLAATFLVGALAWGMTLRPEPVVSLLTLLVLAAMIVFTLAPGFGALALTVPVSALALTGHTTGVVAIAPLVAGAPSIVRWIRSNVRVALLGLAVLGLAGVALTLVLFTLDSDLGVRRGDASLVQQGGLHSYPPWREYIRYWRFDENFGATTVRHLSLVLLLLCVLAVFTRRRSLRTDASVLPARSVGVGLLLLAFVPSKWPWHFGALAAIGAVAVAVEVARLISEGRLDETRRARALPAVLVLTVAVCWSWTGLKESMPFDLVKVAWTDGFNLYSLLATAALVGGVLLLLRRGEPQSPARHSFATIPGIIVTLSALSAVVLTAGVVLVDMTGAPWSPARLNVEALVHKTSGCGLADHLPSAPRLAHLMAKPSSRSILVPDISPYFPCARTPVVEGGRVGLPNIIGIWYDQWPFNTKDSPFQAATDLYDFHRISHDRLLTIYAASPIVPGFERLDVVPDILRPGS